LFTLAGFASDTAPPTDIRWTYSGTRPAHFPEQRVAWLGELLLRNYGNNLSERMYAEFRNENNKRITCDKCLLFFPNEPNEENPVPGTSIRREIIMNTVLPLTEAMRLTKHDNGNIRERIRNAFSEATLPQAYGMVRRFHAQHGMDKKDIRERNWLVAQGVLYILDHFCSQDLQSCCPVCLLAKEPKASKTSN
ncbi:MAG: hypothetical protein K0B52_06020, partial [FCB group bacterium]|nr:hypothetical protein [FCB group bacterium]